MTGPIDNSCLRVGDDEEGIYSKLTSIPSLNFLNIPKPVRRDLLAYDEIISHPGNEATTPPQRIAECLEQIISRAWTVKKQHPTLSSEQDNAFWEIVAKTILPDNHQLLFARPTDLKGIIGFYCAAVQCTASLTHHTSGIDYCFSVMASAASWLEMNEDFKYSLTLSLAEEVPRKRMRSQSDPSALVAKDQMYDLKIQVIDLEIKVGQTIDKLKDTEVERDKLHDKVKEIQTTFAKAAQETTMAEERSKELEVLYQEQQDQADILNSKLEIALFEAEDMRNSNDALAAEAEATQKELGAEVTRLSRELKKSAREASSAAKRAEQRRKKLEKAEQMAAEYEIALENGQRDLDIACREMEKLKVKQAKEKAKVKKDDGEAKKFEQEAETLREELRELSQKFELTRGIADRAIVEWQSCEERARELKVERESYANATKMLQKHVDEEVAFLIQGLADDAGVAAKAKVFGQPEMLDMALMQVGRYLTRLEQVLSLEQAAFDARKMELSLFRVLVGEPFVGGDAPLELVKKLRSLAAKMHELDESDS